LRLAAQSRFGRGGLRAEMPLAHVDWQRTRAFALPSDMTAYVRINLRGREPEGIVAPGREYEQLCDELAEAFASMTNADSGSQAVERVVRFDELFDRPADGVMPDIVVIWSDAEPLRRVLLPGHGMVHAPADDPRTGQHRHLGFLIGAGSGFEAAAEESTGNLLDVAPTALALLGVEHPPLPGRPIEAFVPG
jgi:predicted AlkP superfamily phosphohydrolase/phosphomutase